MTEKELLAHIDQMQAHLTALRDAVLVRAADTASIPASIDEEEAAGICHYCKRPLGDEKPLRGDHPTCYQSIYRDIAAKEITEEEVIRRGWMAPKKPAGRKRKETPIRAMKAAAETYIEAVADKLPPLKAAEEKEGFSRKKPKT